jgi:hypothetical protein
LQIMMADRAPCSFHAASTLWNFSNRKSLTNITSYRQQIRRLPHTVHDPVHLGRPSNLLPGNVARPVLFKWLLDRLAPSLSHGQRHWLRNVRAELFHWPLL